VEACEVTKQLRTGVSRQKCPFRRAQFFELLLGFAQFQPKPTNAKAGEDRLDLVSDPGLLGDEAVSLTVRPFGISR